MEDSQLVQDVVQKQATVGDLINDYIHGLGITAISEKWGISVTKVGEVIKKADAAGKFIPENVATPIDKVTPTPTRTADLPLAIEPLEEGESPAPGTGASYTPKATTKNQVA